MTPTTCCAGGWQTGDGAGGSATYHRPTSSREARTDAVKSLNVGANAATYSKSSSACYAEYSPDVSWIPHAAGGRTASFGFTFRRALATSVRSGAPSLNGDAGSMSTALSDNGRNAPSMLRLLRAHTP